MVSRREGRVEQMYYTTPPHKVLAHNAPPVGNMTEKTPLRIKPILLEQDIAQAQQDLGRVRSERNVALAEKDIAEKRIQVLNQALQMTSRHTDQLSTLEKVGNTTRFMVQKILDFLQKPSTNTGARCKFPTLVHIDDQKPPSVFGDLVDLAGYDDAPPNIDTSPSKRVGTKIELFDDDTLPA